MTILVVDTETTGLKDTDQVVQLAYIELPSQISQIKQGWLAHQFRKFPLFNQYYNPSVDIHEKAYEVHGLDKHFLKKFPPAEECQLPKTCEYMIAHNADFDYRMLGKPEHVKTICTIKLIKTVEKFRNDYFGLRDYKLKTVFKEFYPELCDKYSNDRHIAIIDCYMCLLILLHLVKKFPFLATIKDVHTFLYNLK